MTRQRKQFARTCSRAVPTAALLAIVLTPSAARAQTATAAITGRVTAADGQPLSGVLVSAASAVMPGRITRVTAESGDYRLIGLWPGDYVITYERAGRVTTRRTLVLRAGEHLRLDVSLSPAAEGWDAIVVITDDVTPERRAATVTAGTRWLDHSPLGSRVFGALRHAPGPVASVPALAGVHVNGARLTGFPLHLLPPWEDTVRQVTITAAPSDPRLGDLRGGSIDAITPAGSDWWRGSVRGSIGWAEPSADPRLHARETAGVATSGEYLLGGPLQTGRSWIFASVLHADRRVRSRFEPAGGLHEGDDERRALLVRLTHALNDEHRVDGQVLRSGARPQAVASGPVLQAAALASESHSLWSGAINYTGALSGGVQIEARYEQSGASREHSEAFASELGARTSVIDQASNARWHAPPCAGCGPATTGRRAWLVAANLSAATGRGTHQLTAGYSGRADRRRSGDLPEGGVYEIRATNLAFDGDVPVPVLLPGSSWIIWRDVPGSVDVRADGLFAGDRWDVLPHLTLDLGLRWDRFEIDRGPGTPGWTEQALSPRVGASWSPRQQSPWLITAGIARYADASVFDPASHSRRALDPQRVFAYDGPAINLDAGTVDTRAAVDRALDWFFDTGGPTRAPIFAVTPDAVSPDRASPGRTTQVTVGIDRRGGAETFVRADLFWQWWQNIPADRAAPGQTVVDAFGLSLDRVEPGDAAVPLDRRMVGVALQGLYRIGLQARVGGTYTVSRLSGSAELARPFGSSVFRTAGAYPEYIDPQWAAPSGSLRDDTRHRLHLWIEVDMLVDENRLGVVTLTFWNTLVSGTPFGATGLIDVRPWVDNPGYAQPPPAVPYAFTPRDAFTGDQTSRSDLAVNWWRRLPGTVHGQVFVKLQVLNVFNNVTSLTPSLATVVQTAFTDPGRFTAFNPFTESPVRGVHWDVDPRWEADIARSLTTLPRSLRMSFGVRF